MPSGKPIIFISYAHADEPESPVEGEIKWLTFVLGFLKPAVKHGLIEFWVDRHMRGGATWDEEIEKKLRECDIFVLLVSRHSMASDLHRRQGDRDYPRAAKERGKTSISIRCC
jgi:hypothetical protein